MEKLWLALRATAFPCACTTAGAASVFFVGGRHKESGRCVMNGFAAGVMLAASIFSLLLPAIAAGGAAPWVPATLGFLLGAVLLLLVEARAEALLGGESGTATGRRVVLGITLHNLPEGMVVGLAAVLAAGGSAELRAGAAAISFGIGLQNLPEGAAVSLPLYQVGTDRRRAFAVGTASGLVEPLGGVLAALLAVWVQGLMPWLLAGAAGVMVCVTAQELIPSAAEKTSGLLAFLFGFALMMAMDVAL